MSKLSSCDRQTIASWRPLLLFQQLLTLHRPHYASSKHQAVTNSAGETERRLHHLRMMPQQSSRRSS